MYAWGYNGQGQLGDGTTVDKSSPVKIGSSSWSIVTAADAHTAGITTANTLYIWGFNSVGQLGDNTTVNKSSPVKLGTSSWSLVSTGQSFAAAITSTGALYAWGYNGYGQLGDGTVATKSSPVLVFAPNPIAGIVSWTSVSAGLSHTAGIDTTGSLYTWGSNANGQLGDGTITNRSTAIKLGKSNNPSTLSWISVSAGNGYTAGITSANTAYTWGYNAFGQLGDRTSASKSSPVVVTIYDETTNVYGSWSAVSAGKQSHSVAIDITGGLYAWGDNTYGSLGDSTNINKLVPIKIGDSSWSIVSAGNGYTAGIDITSALYTWGYNNQGQLGDNTTVTKSSPVKIGSSSWSFVYINYNSAGITTANTLYTWGYNPYGQLGDGTTVNKSSPVQLAAPYKEDSFNLLSSGSGNYFYGRGVSGNLYGWGNNATNQLGLPAATSPFVTVPKKLLPENNYFSNNTSWRVIDIVAESSPAVIGLPAGVAAAIDSTGALYTWGYNSTGILGDGTTIDKSTPTKIGNKSWTKVSAGGTHMLAIDTTGALYAWGDNPFGQLGDSTFGNSKSSPVKIGSLSWSVIAASYRSSFGIDITGTLYTWGYNGSGILGDNNPSGTNQSSPVKLTAGGVSNLSWSIVSATKGGADTVAAITSTGALYTWGINVYGNLGVGNTVNTSAVSKVGSSSWAFVSIRTSAMGAITSTGELYTWGYNGQGQLGDGTTINKSSPVKIGQLSWTAVSGSNLAIDITGALYAWGYNGLFAVGDGTTINRSSPVKIGTSSWASISAGGSYANAGITSNNKLFTWGTDTTNVLGNS